MKTFNAEDADAITSNLRHLAKRGTESVHVEARLEEAAALIVQLRTRPATPRNFRELIAYLTARPRVGMVASSPRMTVGPIERFLRYEDGLMWWRTEGDDAQADHHFPVDCGLVGAESGIAFYPFGFTFAKFGIITFVVYLGDSDA